MAPLYKTAIDCDSAIFAELLVRPEHKSLKTFAKMLSIQAYYFVCGSLVSQLKFS